jgi:hypothetical protein
MFENKLNKVNNILYFNFVDYEKIKDVYAFKNRNIFHKIIINVLKYFNIITPYLLKNTSINSFNVNIDNVEKDILKLLDNQNYYKGYNPVILMVGQKQIVELNNINYFNSMTFDFNKFGRLYGGEYLGLKVILNPFIDGYILIDKEMIEAMATFL